MADNEKKLYALATFDDYSENRLAELRAMLIEAGFVGGQTGGIPHHFSLCARDTADEKELLAILKSLENSGNVPIDFAEISAFGDRVLFVTCPVTPSLAALQRAFGVDERWVPHVTMYLCDSGGLTGARAALEREFAPFSGKITAISLYEFFPSRFIAEVKL